MPSGPREGDRPADPSRDLSSQEPLRILDAPPADVDPADGNGGRQPTLLRPSEPGAGSSGDERGEPECEQKSASQAEADQRSDLRRGWAC